MSDTALPGRVREYSRITWRHRLRFRYLSMQLTRAVGVAGLLRPVVAAGSRVGLVAVAGRTRPAQARGQGSAVARTLRAEVALRCHRGRRIRGRAVSTRLRFQKGSMNELVKRK